MEISFRMSRLFIFVNILGLLTWSALALEPVAQRPPDGVHDEAALFSPTEKAALAVELSEALDTQQLEIYVATYQLVKGENMAERAARLRNTWARNPFAIVLVYDETLGQMSFVGSRDLEKFVDRQQLAGAFQRAAVSAKRYLEEQRVAEEKAVPATMIHQTVRALVRDPVLIDRMTLPSSWSFTKPMGVLLAAFLLVILGAGALVWRLERRLGRLKEQGKRAAVFPVTHMPLRLGATYSGGKGVTLGE